MDGWNELPRRLWAPMRGAPHSPLDFALPCGSEASRLEILRTLSSMFLNLPFKSSDHDSGPSFFSVPIVSVGSIVGFATCLTSWALVLFFVHISAHREGDGEGTFTTSHPTSEGGHDRFTFCAYVGTGVSVR